MICDILKTMEKIFCIFMGGGLGSVLRYLTTQMGYKYFRHYFIGTLAVNIIGCFLMGLFMGIFLNKTNIIPNNLKLFITVGFLGGLSTLSALSFEVFEFIKNGKLLHGLSYMCITCIACLFVAFLGYFISTK